MTTGRKGTAEYLEGFDRSPDSGPAPRERQVVDGSSALGGSWTPPAVAAHRKRLLVLRHLLLGKEYHEALTALDFAQRYTTGTRKDGVTPEFDHQVSIALHAMTLPDLTYPEAVVATVMTHDLREDYDIAHSEILGIFTDERIAAQVAGATDRLTKTFRGNRRDDVALFEAMSEDPVASIVKPCDRGRNQWDMVGVFTRTKMESYLDETETLILPMVKRAKRRFPQQTRAYENLGNTLKSQIALVRGFLSMAPSSREEDEAGFPTPKI